MDIEYKREYNKSFMVIKVSKDKEPFEEKMTRLTTELGELFQKSHELEAEIKKQLASIGFEIK